MTVETELEIEDEVLPHAWRNFCAGMILQAAMRVEEVTKVGRAGHKEFSSDVALRWLNGEEAVVPFAEACEATGINPDTIRDEIIRRAERRKRLPQWNPDRPKRIFRSHSH